MIGTVFTRSFLRCFHSGFAPRSSAVSRRVIIPPQDHFDKSRFKGSIVQHEYRQIPDDSNYIEKFYHELAVFNKVCLENELHKSYSDFEDNPSELVFQVEKFVELQIVPRHSTVRDPNTKDTSGYHIPSLNVYCQHLSDKLVIERYVEFIKAVSLTLRLNGGHTFIFDILLTAKSVYDRLESDKLSS
ncbi:Fmp23p KNAG_0J00940 [Huiozyma naganishii CBS 8797]|uniref:Protein FMP23, mitochondrial n=1 Tax=Huiozyma naganishii (strain ATCC MYA-139 / BCRC 22969 / CBS 8797 / KCTC 17520 / NBRC 10181 / NCYC 3082 / Yp74L-3) TaxID=1071383 RepID=J7SAH6_HUIN7|nr:hypothetical protein KNAG_0J00940 [Kazachstania naganishii CBS 8797]CCK72176.1 hypothetical protein KNAG_0J00940 [Kazachstania naganishii CBS 8797]